MNGTNAFRALLALLIVGFLGFAGIAATTNFLYAWMDIWSSMWGRVMVLDLGLMLFLAGCWAIYRDGWVKGIAWMICFFALGSAGVMIHVLWNLRYVGEPGGMESFFRGRHVYRNEKRAEARESGIAPVAEAAA